MVMKAGGFGEIVEINTEMADIKTPTMTRAVRWLG